MSTPNPTVADARGSDPIQDLIIRMRRGPTIDRFTVADVYKEILRIGAETLAPSLHKLAERTQPDAPAALALNGARERWLVRLGDVSDQDRDLPESFFTELGLSRRTDPGGPVRSIAVYPCADPFALHKRLGAKGWAPAIVDVSLGFEDRDTGVWSAGNNNVSTLENWRDFFGAAQAAVEAAGLSSDLESQRNEVSRRAWDDPFAEDPSLAVASAALAFARNALRADRGLPGLHADRALLALERSAIQWSLEAVLPRITKILGQGQSLTGVDQQKDFNDGRERIWLVQNGVAEAICCSNQNRAYVATIQRDRGGEIIRLDLHVRGPKGLSDADWVAGALGDDPSDVKASFTFSGGAPVLQLGDLTSLSFAKNWNGFIDTIATCADQLPAVTQRAKTADSSPSEASPKM